MLQTGFNSDFSQAMDLFKEIDDLSDLFLLEKNTKLNSAEEGYEDLQTKYSSLHENYEKEMDNSKKIEKCLVKCLKFYSKLCKKYEFQQKIISNLEASIKEKTSRLEEAQRNEEIMKGLIQVYRTERTLYSSQTNAQLRKDKEILLDICCKVISDPCRNHNIRNMASLLLRKFKKDLDNEMINLLKEKSFKVKDEFDLNTTVDLKTENIGESPSPNKFTQNTSVALNLQKHSANSTQSEPQELSTRPGGSISLFDISDSCSNHSNFEVQIERNENAVEEMQSKPEVFSAVLFERKDQSEDPILMSNANEVNINLVKSEEEIGFPFGEELCKIFREMSSVRFLSPIRESPDSLINNNISSVVSNENEIDDCGNSEQCLKRNSKMEEIPCKNKKLRPEEEAPNFNLLDSIMSAMSIQNEEFKSKGIAAKESEESTETTEENSSKFANLGGRTYARRNQFRRSNYKENSIIVHKNSGDFENRKQTIDKRVTDEIKNFVSSPISSKEDADKNVGRCLSVLSNISEDVIAKCIVAIVLENVDEAVEIFERPSPPLTKTQHRLIVLLSVFRTMNSNLENISIKILSLIWEKIFPDNFFWPDDSIEAATRFYAALCRARNDPKTLWRFCLHAMTDMRQRCPLLMFTVLKTWPDILHDASTLKNNILAVTIVNIFLHMPKKEGFRNFNQGRKLLALKHLLMNFYQFKIEDSIENYAKKVFEALCREELGSEKSVVLLSKCQNENWTVKNMVPMLKSTLVLWSEGKMEDSVANRILSVMKQICPILQEEGARTKVKDVISCLSEILISAKKSHDLEVNIIEVLLRFKQNPEVRKVIREWIPKKPISDSLRNEVINVSAENILREVKLNRRKEPKNFTQKKKMKKSKVKKKRGKKSKKNLQKPKVESPCS